MVFLERILRFVKRRSLCVTQPLMNEMWKWDACRSKQVFSRVTLCVWWQSALCCGSASSGPELVLAGAQRVDWWLPAPQRNSPLLPGSQSQCSRIIYYFARVFNSKHTRELETTLPNKVPHSQSNKVSLYSFLFDVVNTKPLFMVSFPLFWNLSCLSNQTSNLKPPTAFGKAI